MCAKETMDVRTFRNHLAKYHAFMKRKRSNAPAHTSERVRWDVGMVVAEQKMDMLNEVIEMLQDPCAYIFTEWEEDGTPTNFTEPRDYYDPEIEAVVWGYPKKSC